MNILLLYADKYYLVNQVYPLGLSLIANYLRKRGHAVEVEPHIQASIYDYLFKRLVAAEKQSEAKTISLKLLDNIERGEPVDTGQADTVRFYLSCLG